MTIERVLPVEVVLRDLAAWAKRPSTGEPYCLWIDGINAALKERDAEIERLQRACVGAIRFLGLVKNPDAHRAEVLLRAVLAGKEEKT